MIHEEKMKYKILVSSRVNSLKNAAGAKIQACDSAIFLLHVCSEADE
jgi:hypothetical protein